MKRLIQLGLVLAISIAPVAFAQPKAILRPPVKGFPKGLPKKGGPGREVQNVERLLAMPPEQRDRVLEKLPPKQQVSHAGSLPDEGPGA